MKASELMLNDWVFSDVRKMPWQILQSDVRRMVREYSDVFDLDNDFNAIKPIPLTGDILKVNGFTFNNVMQVWECYVGTPGDSIEIDFEHCEVRGAFDVFFNKDKGGSIFELEYVHELQHALRLCGLSELADNFKIE